MKLATAKVRRFAPGDKVVVDGTLIVTLVRELADNMAILETGHGSLVANLDRVTPFKIEGH